MDIADLAVLANDLGGIEPMAEFLGVPSGLAYKAFSATPLTRRELAELRSAYDMAQLDEDRSFDVDYEDLGFLAGRLREYQQDLPEQSEWIGLARGFASRQIDADSLYSTDELLDLYGDEYDIPRGANQSFDMRRLDILMEPITFAQRSSIIDLLEQGEDVQELLDAYITDRLLTGSIWGDELEDSLFWALFRIMVYGED